MTKRENLQASINWVKQMRIDGHIFAYRGQPEDLNNWGAYAGPELSKKHKLDPPTVTDQTGLLLETLRRRVSECAA